jgi:hypothetical protein
MMTLRQFLNTQSGLCPECSRSTGRGLILVRTQEIGNTLVECQDLFHGPREVEKGDLCNDFAGRQAIVLALRPQTCADACLYRFSFSIYVPCYYVALHRGLSSKFR